VPVPFLPSQRGMTSKRGALSGGVLCVLTLACGGNKEPTGPTDIPGSNTNNPPPSGWSSGVQLTEDFGGRALFPSDNWWNQDISSAPVDPESDAYLSFIGRTRTSHPDFGPPPYGIPYVGVGGNEPRAAVTFVDYGSESDSGLRGEVGYPIPAAAQAQPNYIEGGVAGGGSSGDRHLLIVDRDKWALYELFAARWNSSARRWEAGSGAVFDLSSNTRRPEGWTSADAAGLARPGAARLPTHRSRDERLRLAGVASRREYVGRAADGCASAVEGVEEPGGVPALHSKHLPCDADARADRRRQR
jgi:hypothetical protein